MLSANIVQYIHDNLVMVNVAAIQVKLGSGGCRDVQSSRSLLSRRGRFIGPSDKMPNPTILTKQLRYFIPFLKTQSIRFITALSGQRLLPLDDFLAANGYLQDLSSEEIL